MALNPTINRLKALSGRKVAGERSLTLGETIAFVILVLVVMWKEKVPIVKGWSQRTATILALGVMFLVLWID